MLTIKDMNNKERLYNIYSIYIFTQFFLTFMVILYISFDVKNKHVKKLPETFDRAFRDYHWSRHIY